jgi:hypothetical protein
VGSVRRNAILCPIRESDWIKRGTNFPIKKCWENADNRNREKIFLGNSRILFKKEDCGLDLMTTMQTIAPYKAGMGIGVMVLIYGSVKMEFSFGVLGFILCLVAGFVVELFV